LKKSALQIFSILPIRLLLSKHLMRIGFSIRVSIYGCIILHGSIFCIRLSALGNNALFLITKSNKGEKNYVIKYN